MPTFRYRALNQAGRSQSGTLYAENRDQAMKNLEKQGMRRIFLKSPSLWSRTLESRESSARREPMLCCRQLAVMLQSGMALSQALEILLRQPLAPGLYRAYLEVTDRIHQGCSLSQAMHRFPGQFDPMVRGLVQVGEKTGNLARNLEEAALHLERESNLRDKLASALRYPLVVSAISILLTYLMVQHILPRFLDGLFQQAGIVLPWYTQVLVATTRFLSNPTWMLTSLTLLGLLAWTLGSYLRTTAGQLVAAELAMSWGPSRRFLGRILAVRVARTLATAIDAGIPAVQALELTGEAGAHPYLTQFLAVATEDLKDGNSLARSLRAIPFLPPMFCSFVELGEESARLPVLLLKSAEMLELEIDEVIESCTQMLEPLLMGVLGCLVGFVLIALFVPIYQVLGSI